ncbi:hypothetical protein [Sphingomonas sp. Leaf412]|uniref:hypothetical protein n=1 Tax=Sphingomonas sp. Leaf412 TaxID=1736370 RepID=UPI000B1A383B|nr:hypothetical protein [Sphingomonas sp. Leaf412]
MTRLLKSSFLWQFAGGFMIGAVGMGALAAQSDATPAATTPAAIHAPTDAGR